MGLNLDEEVNINLTTNELKDYLFIQIKLFLSLTQKLS